MTPEQREDLLFSFALHLILPLMGVLVGIAVRLFLWVVKR